MRTPLLVANWKMNKQIAEAQAFAEDFLPRVQGVKDVEIVICPPLTALEAVRRSLQDSLVKLGAQDVFWEEKGAYTGEVSPSMLLDAGCSYVIIGHSERRQILGERDVDINRKLKAALEGGLTPILCVGETLQERENNRALEIVKGQINEDLQGLRLEESNLVVAYEPVWAIGTGVNASPDDAQEMIGFIRSLLARNLGKTLADEIRILYGGSVKPENTAQFMAEADVDGALVGGASLQAESMARIVRFKEP